MVLRLRFSPELWGRVSRRQPDFDRKVEDFLAGSECCWFEERDLEVDREAGAITHVIATREFEFCLRRSSGSVAWDYDLMSIRPRVEGDVPGVRLRDEIIVLRPDAAPTSGELISGDIVFIVNAHKYRQLPNYEKGPLNIAWNCARRGRVTRRVFYDGETIFTLTSNGSQASTARDAENLDMELQETGVGRLLTDEFELKRARQLTERYGETLKHT